MLFTLCAIVLSNTMNVQSALWILMAWCFSTRASVTTALTTHPCVSRCLELMKQDKDSKKLAYSAGKNEIMWISTCQQQILIMHVTKMSKMTKTCRSKMTKICRSKLNKICRSKMTMICRSKMTKICRSKITKICRSKMTKICRSKMTKICRSKMTKTCRSKITKIC